LRIRLSADGRTIKARAKGEFDFTDDESDFLSISPGGWFWIEDRRSGHTQHRIEVRAAAGGAVERKYERNGDAHAFDDEGRAWLADVLHEIFANTNFATESHIRRVVKRSGVDAAVEEIARIDSDHSKCRAYRYLLDVSATDPAVAPRIASEARTRVESDHELAELLIDLVDAKPADATVLAACVEASQGIESDHEQGRALRSVIDPGKPSHEVLSALFVSAKGIESDHERAELLIDAAAAHQVEPATAGTFFEAAQGIESDHEMGRVLSAVLETRDLDPGVLQPLLVSTRGIESAHEKAEVLLDVLDRQKVEGAVRDEFVEAAQSIDSDHERGRVMDRLQGSGS
jgi:hypothetical protein